MIHLSNIISPDNGNTEIRGPSVFLAGGITGTENWQNEVIDGFKDAKAFTLVNPRWNNFPIDDPGAAHKQIKWEHYWLKKADIISFWFPPETLCPIALYELGAWSMTNKPIVVGCDPEYKRKIDVSIQTSLVRPEVTVHLDLIALQYGIIGEVKKLGFSVYNANTVPGKF